MNHVDKDWQLSGGVTYRDCVGLSMALIFFFTLRKCGSTEEKKNTTVTTIFAVESSSIMRKPLKLFRELIQERVNSTIEF